ncbi:MULTISPECIES: hypothetical protein [Streptomyces]|uniref:Uncharacterized protein n=1 Tax=Streptomyces ramulosus TaxID=47762 RepID=A0ABW1FBH6_9ACTN
MDPEIATLAGSAGTALVGALATDAWHGVRDRVLALWQRTRPEQAPGVAGDLDGTREELLAAPEGAGRDAVAAESGTEWQVRLRRLLTAHPELAGELRALVADLTPPEAPAPAVTQHATASGDARVYQAGRDMRIGGADG